jgi:hypothetical protein
MSQRLEIGNLGLQNRLRMIIQTVPHFWEQRLYTHFTNHGPEHSERVLNQKIAQLAQGLPLENRLTEDEIFIISAAAWLYEIGMQSPNLQPILDFAYEPGVPLTTDQLLQIRERKHLLTRQLIADSIRPNYTGPRISLGLSNELDDYTRAIAEVCRWCSQEPLEEVDKFIPVSGILVRLRLLVALLRLADQLYIDSARVNREQLLAFHLPPQVEARWWAYHYTQILPINKGKIRFYYSLPIGHKQYLGHIRALIEPTFDYENNPLIRYLDEEHDLSLSVLQQPQVRLDQQEGFLQEMPWEMVAFLRSSDNVVKPIQSERGNVELVGYTEEKPQERRPLLVLDYENLLLQLGLDGYFPTFDELKKLIFAITVKAPETLGDMADLWALGHWQRPDMQRIKEEFEKLTYQLKPIYDDQKNADTLMGEFAPFLQRPNAPSKTLLVAPREELSPVVKQFRDRDVPVTAWLCNVVEMSIFRAITRQPQPLAQIVQLPDSAHLEQDKVQEWQDMCILKLEDALQGKPGGLAITDVASVLDRLAELRGQGEWWKLWLLKQGILLCEETQNGYSVKLDGSHKAVNAVHTLRTLVISLAQNLANSRLEVARATLLDKLANAPQLRDQRERVARFCQFLQSGGLLLPVKDLEDVQWRLNDEHWSYLAENAELYLPLLVIGIDHFLLYEGYPCIHEHSLPGKLAGYVGYNTVRTIYHLAREKGMVRSRESAQRFRDSGEHMVEVRLAEEHAEVRQALRNCNLLLHSLYNRGSSAGLTRDELWDFLMKRMQRCFTLSPQAFDRWLTVFQNVGILKQKPQEGPAREPVRLLLDLDKSLVICLLARPQLLNLIKQMRVSGAGRMPKPTKEILEKFTKYITRDFQLSTFALKYAREQRIVTSRWQNNGGQNVECVVLADSPFVRDLDRRNLATCTVLAKVVAGMSQKFPQGRVPENKLLQEMEHDSRYGIAHEEYRYWINQAIYLHDLLEGDPDQGNTGQPYYRVKPKPVQKPVPVEVR